MRVLVLLRRRSVWLPVFFCLLFAGLASSARAVDEGNFPDLADGLTKCNGQRQVQGEFHQMVYEGGERHVWLRFVLWVKNETLGLGGFKIRKLEVDKWVDDPLLFTNILSKLNAQVPSNFDPLPSSVPNSGGWRYFDIELNEDIGDIEAGAQYQIINTGNVFHVGVLRKPKADPSAPLPGDMFVWRGHTAKGYNFADDYQADIPTSMMLNLEENLDIGRERLPDIGYDPSNPPATPKDPLQICKNDTIQLSAYIENRKISDWFTYEWKPSQGLAQAGMDSCTATYEGITQPMTVEVSRLGVCDIKSSSRVKVELSEPLQPVLVSSVPPYYCGPHDGKVNPAPAPPNPAPVEFRVKGIGEATHVVFLVQTDGDGEFVEQASVPKASFTNGGKEASWDFPIEYTSLKPGLSPPHKRGDPVTHRLRILARNGMCRAAVTVPIVVQEAVKEPVVELVQRIKDPNNPNAFIDGGPIDMTAVPPSKLCSPVGIQAQASNLTTEQRSRFWHEWDIGNVKGTAKIIRLQGDKAFKVRPGAGEVSIPLTLKLTNKHRKCPATFTASPAFIVKPGVIANIAVKSSEPGLQCVPLVETLDPTSQGNPDKFTWTVKLWDGEPGTAGATSQPLPALNGAMYEHPVPEPHSGGVAVPNGAQAPNGDKVDLCIDKLQAGQYVQVSLKVQKDDCPDEMSLLLPLSPTPYAAFGTASHKDATGADPANYVHANLPDNSAVAGESYCSPMALELPVENLEAATGFRWVWEEFNDATGKWKSHTFSAGNIAGGATTMDPFRRIFVNTTMKDKRLRVKLFLNGASGCARELSYEFTLRGYIKPRIVIPATMAAACPDDKEGNRQITIEDNSELPVPKLPTINYSWEVRDLPTTAVPTPAFNPATTVGAGATAGEYLYSQKNTSFTKDLGEEIRLKIEDRGCVKYSDPKVVKTYPRVDPEISLQQITRDIKGNFTAPYGAWPNVGTATVQELCAPVKIKYADNGGAEKLDFLLGSTPLTSDETVLYNKNEDGLGVRTYVLNLKGSNRFGCERTASLDLKVFPEVKAKIWYDVRTPICNPLIVDFRDDSQCYESATNSCPAAVWEWDGGVAPTDPSITVPSPPKYVKEYTGPGDKEVHFTVTSTDGCAQESEVVKFKVPDAQSVVLAPLPLNEVCSGAPIEASATATNCTDVNFYFEAVSANDLGTGEAGVEEAPAGSGKFSREHVYENKDAVPITYQVYAQGKNSNGCKKLSAPQAVQVYPLPAIHDTYTVVDNCMPTIVEIGSVNVTDDALKKHWRFEPVGPNAALGGAVERENQENLVESVELVNNSTADDFVDYKMTYQAYKVWPGGMQCPSAEQDLGTIQVPPAIRQVFALNNPGDPALVPIPDASNPVAMTQVCSGDKISIDNSSTGGQLSHLWEFGLGGPVETTANQIGIVDRPFFNDGKKDVVIPVKVITTQGGTGCQKVFDKMNVRVHPAVVASFKMTPQDKCAYPLNVHFTNESHYNTDATSSTKPDETLFTYDFGYTYNGVAQKAEKRLSDPDFLNFDALFYNEDPNAPASYKVKLTAVQTYTGGFECSDVTDPAQDIKVNAELKPDFGISIGGVVKAHACVPFTADFKNKSTGAADTEILYTWDWGDQSDKTEMSQNNGTVSHGFIDESLRLEKLYTVRLTAERKGDKCKAFAEKVVTAYPKVRPSFKVNGTSFCTPTVDKEIKAENTTENAAEYTWTVTGAGISLAPIVQDATHRKVEFPSLTNGTSAPIVATIKLVAEKKYPTSGEVCSEWLEQPIELLPALKADFTQIDPPAKNCSPYKVQLENTSIGVTEFTWKVNGVDYGQNDKLETTFNNDDPKGKSKDFKVVLEVTNGTCSKQKEQIFKVFPQVDNQLMLDVSSGCTPLSVQPSSTADPTMPYTYKWVYEGADRPGDNVANPTQKVVFENDSQSPLVNQTGKVTLITTLNGSTCSSELTREITIHPGAYPKFDAPAPGCAPLKVELYAGNSNVFQETGRSPLYIWKVNGETKTGERSQFLLANGSQTQNGEYTIELTARSLHGCEGTVSHDVTVWPKPIAKVRAYAKDDPDQKRQSGCPDLEVVVANESRGKNLTYTYDLGDGQTANQTTLAPIDHTYYNTLDEDKPYVISLTAESDKGCKDEDKTTVTVFPGLDVDFEYSQTDASGNKTGKKEGCSPFDVLFESKAVGAHEFYWDFGDGEPGAEIKPSGEAVRFHRYVNREITDQTYNVKLKAKNSKGCWAESEVKKVTVYATPVPEFTLDPYKQTWPNNEVRIVNTTDPMSSKWEFDWTYGDGNVSKGQTPTSTPYVYEQWALRDWDYAYTITLSAFNTEHPECKGTMTDYAYIMPPIPTPSFTALRSEACAPFQVVLQNTTEYKKDMEFEWDFGDDGDKSTEPDPVHTYYEPGIYQVTLTARGEGGHATAYGVYVAHGKPLVKFEMAPKQVMLPKARVKAQNGSTDWDGSPLGEGTKYFWDFGDGTTSEEVSPVKEYERAGEFDVSLHVESAMGCADELRIEKAVTVLPAGWIKFPNVFSPPLSGMNDGYYGDLSPEDFCTIFYPDYRGVSDYHLMIFDRWGSLVFETRDIKRGWDGTRKRKVMGGGCAMGVYAWRATGHYFNGTVFDKRGNVTLLR